MNTLTKNIKQVYLIGIGGIGMSALARYYANIKLTVAGYDLTPSSLTKKLVSEGIAVQFDDNTNIIPTPFINTPQQTLVVYTPAIPTTNNLLQYFRNNSYRVLKRAEALGLISEDYQTAAVAGTHGKTSTSTLLAHILNQTSEGCNAFVGGISKNFASNVLLNSNSNRLVVEADEYDRSFLNLKPNVAIITSIDADHLDIYNTHNEVKRAFSSFISNIKNGGNLIIKSDIKSIADGCQNIKVYTYSIDEKADFYPSELTNKNGIYTFNLATPFGVIKNLTLGVPGKFNVENSIAASAAAVLWGINEQNLKEGLSSFKGISRRFDLQHQGKSIFIDDYAHHPTEIKAAIASLKEMFPKRRIAGVFQPHLYSRTRDFAADFAKSLSLLDELILLDIYPAREQPIPGVTSKIIFDKVQCKSKKFCSTHELIDVLNDTEIDILITMGAGNIDREVPKIVELLKQKEQ
ncbi:MAG: UDP-N-acetylmuramate--L-alanine ligase [Tenuifilaceae bacterium]|nr:UDP-N-acetylmuramate--L-alanine ligase [Tenuifilaceae bacterium]